MRRYESALIGALIMTICGFSLIQKRGSMSEMMLKISSRQTIGQSAEVNVTVTTKPTMNLNLTKMRSNSAFVLPVTQTEATATGMRNIAAAPSNDTDTTITSGGAMTGPQSTNDAAVKDGVSGTSTEVDTAAISLYELQPINPVSSCWRSCPRRINKILIDDMDKGGLNDRRFVLGQLGNLAGFLCATVDAPPPSVMLWNRHNKNNVIDPRMPWSDLIDLQFFQDNSSVLANSTSTIEDPLKRFNPHDYKDWLIRKTLNKTTLLDDFLAVKEFSFAQEQAQAQKNSTNGFIWVITLNYWEWPPTIIQYLSDYNQSKSKNQEAVKTMLPELGGYHAKIFGQDYFDGCVYGNWNHPPVSVQRIADDVWNVILLSTESKTIYGSLHIRRGDAEKICDTSTDAIREYVRCSFSEMNKNTTNNRSVGVLFSSDEDDPNYRETIKDIVMNSSTIVSFFDLDSMVVKAVKAGVARGRVGTWNLNNNYFWFRVTQELQSRSAAFVMEKRRFYACPKCTNVLASLKAATKNPSP